MTRLSSEARKEVALHEGAASARGVCRAPANARVGAFREEEGCVLGLQHQPLELGGAGEPLRGEASRLALELALTIDVDELVIARALILLVAEVRSSGAAAYLYLVACSL